MLRPWPYIFPANQYFFFKNCFIIGFRVIQVNCLFPFWCSRSVPEYTIKNNVSTRLLKACFLSCTATTSESNPFKHLVTSASSTGDFFSDILDSADHSVVPTGLRHVCSCALILSPWEVLRRSRKRDFAHPAWKPVQELVSLRCR